STYFASMWSPVRSRSRPPFLSDCKRLTRIVSASISHFVFHCARTVQNRADSSHCAQSSGVPSRSIKAEVKKKHLPLRLEFFLLRSPLERTRSVLTCRGMSSVAGRCGPQRFGFSLPAVFIARSRRSPSVPKPAKQNGGQVATIVLFETRGL